MRKRTPLKAFIIITKQVRPSKTKHPLAASSEHKFFIVYTFPKKYIKMTFLYLV